MVTTRVTTPISPTPHGVGGLKYKAYADTLKQAMSHPSRGGWIEITSVPGLHGCLLGPTPHGVGGLKYSQRHRPQGGKDQSHPSRGGWIEIRKTRKPSASTIRPTPHGVGGLKLPHQQSLLCQGSGPTPHGVGGLKFDTPALFLGLVKSHPSRGGWIEMVFYMGT